MMQLRKEGHNFQFMATEDAISSYNFMTAENRVVAAALIPPVSVSEGAKCTPFTGWENVARERENLSTILVSGRTMYLAIIHENNFR